MEKNGVEYKFIESPHLLPNTIFCRSGAEFLVSSDIYAAATQMGDTDVRFFLAQLKPRILNSDLQLLSPPNGGN